MELKLEVNVKIDEYDDVVVIRGLEAPNVIVEGKDRKEAIEEFKKAYCFYLNVKRNRATNEYPLAEKAKIHSLPMEFVSNG